MPDEQIPPIHGLMACTRCLAVLAYAAWDVEDFERCGGRAWKRCPGCRSSRWFMPFTITPAPTPDGTRPRAASER